MVLLKPLLPLAVFLLIGCDAVNERAARHGAEPGGGGALTAPGAVSVAGVYRVAGTTTEPGSDVARPIEGTVVLTQDGDRYRASFELSTLSPTLEGDQKASVIGQGEGTVSGGSLEGTAQTQIVVASVPGVDTDFAFIPRAVTTRIESVSKASVGADGSLVIEIDNVAAPGERYGATHTRLVGERVALASSAVEANAAEAD